MDGYSRSVSTLDWTSGIAKSPVVAGKADEQRGSGRMQEEGLGPDRCRCISLPENEEVAKPARYGILVHCW